MAAHAATPAFGTRGLQPFHDFASGPDWWNYQDYKVGCNEAGKFYCVFSSDLPSSGGWDNLKEGTEHFADEGGWHDGRPASFQCYAPSRTVAVYAPARLVDAGIVPGWWKDDWEATLPWGPDPNPQYAYLLPGNTAASA